MHYYLILYISLYYFTSSTDIIIPYLSQPCKTIFVLLFDAENQIPQAQRDELLLLADGSHVMWVIGYRISDYYKVDEHTKRVLEVRYDGGKEDE